MHKRYVELDLLRTLAILAMIVYHAAYDLEFFYGWSLTTERGAWWLFGHATAVLFLLLVGVSFAISSSRHTGGYGKYLKRGLAVFACGLIVSGVTYVVDPETYVRFGVLHLIGISILLLPFFRKLKEGNALVGIVIVGLGVKVTEFTASTSLFLPLGLQPTDFFTVDYFPLLPWFGWVLIGHAIGHFLYVRHQLHIRSQEWLLPRTKSWMTWPGRHALVIYLVHQPLLLGFFGILGFFGFLHP